MTGNQAAMESITAELRLERNRRRRRRTREARTPVPPIAGLPRHRGPLLTFLRRHGTTIDVGRAPVRLRVQLERAGFHAAPKRRWRKSKRRRAV